MNYISTRSDNQLVSISEAIQMGLGFNGGLFVPEKFPKFEIQEFESLFSIIEVAKKFLHPFFQDDFLSKYLDDIIDSTFDFPIKLFEFEEYSFLLELFHGPTGAFKDVGARFLARCFSKLSKEITILVATSGDTGSAVASAFHGLKGIKVCILYPKGKISKFQEDQITSWDDNILALKVNGDFDTCQKLVKSAFSDSELVKTLSLSSANSINIGRLLPQCVYYVWSSLKYYKKYGKKASFIVPTGNMGNVMACIWVKKMGFPIAEIKIATNENKVIPLFFERGLFQPQSSIKTLANAMDVGDPSNFERYRHFIINQTENVNFNIEPINEVGVSISDSKISETIKKVYSDFNLVICPHTATAFSCWYDIPKPSIIVSTAHPSKFGEVLKPIIGFKPEYPAELGEILKRKKYFVNLEPSVDNLKSAIVSYYNLECQ